MENGQIVGKWIKLKARHFYELFMKYKGSIFMKFHFYEILEKAKLQGQKVEVWLPGVKD